MKTKRIKKIRKPKKYKIKPFSYILILLSIALLLCVCYNLYYNIKPLLTFFQLITAALCVIGFRFYNKMNRIE
jgi:uncharacterized membrane protein